MIDRLGELGSELSAVMILSIRASVRFWGDRAAFKKAIYKGSMQHKEDVQFYLT